MSFAVQLYDEIDLETPPTSGHKEHDAGPSSAPDVRSAWFD